MKQPTIAIIGGGAAGMVAALAASGPGARVELYEAQPRLGKKLLATGNGRCNFSHKGFSKANYHGGHVGFVSPAFAVHDEADTLAFFEGLGLAVMTDERDRYYPQSLQAQAVLDLLRLALDEAGINVHTDTRIAKILPTPAGFDLGRGRRADAVVVATGGEAAPALGGTRDGYELLTALGHSLVPTAPGIVQLVCDLGPLKACKGLKRVCGLTILADGKPVATDHGEILITSYGLSGPPVLQCAGAAVCALNGDAKVQACISFFPGLGETALLDQLTSRRDAHPNRDAAAFFVGMLPRLLAQSVLKRTGVAIHGALDDASLKKIARTLCQWSLPVKGPRPFSDAQVTLGGIDTADFDSDTLGSWLVPGLFAAGEVFDIDGDCGGYNLQWAWSSGRLAGRSAWDYVTQQK